MRGLYTAASVMLAIVQYQALLAKNVANASTTGYKAERVRFDTFESLLLGLGSEGSYLGLGVNAVRAPLDLRQGPLKETNRLLDVAITERGFLMVQTEDGVRLTRDGSLGLDGQRRLITADGHLVLGAAGPITLPEGEVSISEDGQLFVDGAPVATLALAVIEDEREAVKVGHNLIDAPNRPVAAGEALVLQGYLEGSNVNLGDSLTKMLAVLRTYEAAQRVAMAQSEAVDAAANQVGQV